MEAATKQHTGKAPDEDLPGDNGAEGRTDEVVQLSIQGDNDLSSRVGGRKPDEATIRLQGGELQMGKTQFDKGQRVRLVVEGYIAEVHDKDIRDPKTSQVSSSKKKHILKIDHAEKVPLVEES
jgi:hypothetical protein